MGQPSLIWELSEIGRKCGPRLKPSVGMEQKDVKMGRIGFERLFDYAPIGTVTNLATRLCGEAGGGEILINQRVCVAREALPVALTLVQLVMIKYPNYHAARAGAAAMTLATDFVDQLNGCAC
jgi:class 3 adenylate cyclase